MKEIPYIKLNDSEIRKSIPTLEDKMREFTQIMKEENPHLSDDDIGLFLSECKDIEKFVTLYIKLYKSKKHFVGRNLREDTKIMFFNMIDELNRAYGDCIVDGSIEATDSFMSYESYRKEVEENKRRRAKSFCWTLWDIKNVYAKAFRCALPEKNGKVTKGSLITALSKMVDKKIIYDYDVRDIILEEDKNGKKIWTGGKGQYQSFFRPGNTVHGSLGPRYKELL